jgi:hypothetical protein
MRWPLLQIPAHRLLGNSVALWSPYHSHRCDHSQSMKNQRDYFQKLNAHNILPQLLNVIFTSLETPQKTLYGRRNDKEHIPKMMCLLQTKWDVIFEKLAQILDDIRN